MEQQQQAPGSPVRAAAAAAANAALAAGTSMAVTRSASVESHDAASIGTSPSADVSQRGGSGNNCGGSVGGESHGNSFRASPTLTTPRQPVSMAGAPSFPANPAGGANNPAVAAPPPWDKLPAKPRSASPQLVQSASPRLGPSHSGVGGDSPVVPPISNFPPAAPQQQQQNTALPPAPVLSDSRTMSFPNQSASLSLSLTKSGDTLFSQGSPSNANTAASHEYVTSGGHVAAGGAGGPNAQTASNTSDASRNFSGSQGNTSCADSSVLLGLEELERQQADVEKRRAEKLLAEQRAKAQQLAREQGGGGARHSSGLPPLAPSSGPAQFPPGAQLRPLSAPASSGGGVAGSGGEGDVPSQIHLLEDDEDTILSSDVAGGKGSKEGGDDRNKELKRVVSIEKLRGSVQVGLRRFRSWSQDALMRNSMDNPAGSSVDSTQQATLTSAEGGGGGGGQKRDTVDTTATGSTQRRSTAKSGSKKTNSESIVSEPYLDDDELKPLIYGYLHKLGRNGHWQKRFFETNGERLTYYKSMKRNKILATLDLCKVGEIVIDRTDPDECTFTIQVKNRPYYLRAEDKARCNDWVITLNRAREARMHVGNIQLVTHKLEGGDGALTHRSQAGSDDFAQPCIVISAQRPRTRAVSNFQREDVQNPPDLLTSTPTTAGEEEKEEIEVMKWEDHPSPTSAQAQQQQIEQQGVVGVVGSGVSSPPVGDTQSMAKWQKRHSKMHMLSLRFLKWARSITHQADACRRETDVVVVPAHVVLAAQQQQALSPSTQGVALPGSVAASAATGAASSTGADGNQQGTKHRRKPSSGLPDLLEETQQAPSTPGAETPDNSTHNRSRASTESPAFGSAYV